jgi:hypothetical protein
MRLKSLWIGPKTTDSTSKHAQKITDFRPGCAATFFLQIGAATVQAQSDLPHVVVLATGEPSRESRASRDACRL